MTRVVLFPMTDGMWGVQMDSPFSYNDDMKKYLLYFLLGVHLFVILYFWLMSSGFLAFTSFAEFFLAFGRLFGLLAVTCVLLQFLLIGRSRWIEELFGLDKLSRVHHYNGYLAFTFILLHPLFITFGYASSSKTNAVQQFITLISTNRNILFAFCAVLLFITIIFASVYIIRKRLKYETWYFVHLLNYAAISLAFLHQLELGSDFLANPVFKWYWYALYTAVAVNHIFFRFLRQTWLFYKHRFTVQKVEKETSDTTSVYIGGKNLPDFKIDAGQFLIYRFLNKKLWWQAHPFSVSYYPSSEFIRLTPKQVGDYTSELPTIQKGTKVLIDGPFGIFTGKLAVRPKFLFIAGGVGITPIFAMIQKLVLKQKDIFLLYSNKTEREVIFKKEFDTWARQGLIRLRYIMTQDKKFKGEQGRLDKEKIQRIVPDLKKREIYLCGPVPFMEAVKQALMELGVEKKFIHYEKFSL